MIHDSIFKQAFVFLCVAVMLLGTGCQPRSLPGLVPCRGTITLDDVPVADATVTLIPKLERSSDVSNTASRNARASTDSQGRFIATTLKENDGVYPGEYRVAVAKYERSGKIVELPEIDPETGKNLLFEPSVNRLPPKYEFPLKSGLELTVPATGLKNAELKLATQ